MISGNFDINEGGDGLLRVDGKRWEGKGGGPGGSWIGTLGGILCETRATLLCLLGDILFGL